MVFFSDDLAEDIGKWQWRGNVKNQSNEGVASIAFVSCSSITFFWKLNVHNHNVKHLDML